jgi:hypothetical protein
MSRTRRSSLTETQIKAAELYAWGATNDKVSEETGMSVRALTNWKKRPEFIDEVVYQSRHMLSEGIPQVYAIVLEKAKLGIPWACQLLFKHFEFLSTTEAKKDEGQIVFNWGTEPPSTPAPVETEEEEPPAPIPPEDPIN